MSILPTYGSQILGFSGNADLSISQPRISYTFFVELVINSDAPVGNFLTDGVNTGRFFTAVKSTGKPGLEFELEKLRSYNSYYLLNKKVQHKDVSMVFHDDSTSFIQGLLKAYRAYYSNAGNTTSDASDIERYPLGSSVSNSDGQTGTTGSSPYGKRMTSSLESMGLRLQAKPFFSKIKIYDLGTEPNSINVYTLIDPMIVSIERGTLDYSNSTLQEVTISLAYPAMNEEIGVQLTDVIKNSNFLSIIADANPLYAQRSGHFAGGSSTPSNTDSSTADQLDDPVNDLLDEDDDTITQTGNVDPLTSDITYDGTGSVSQSVQDQTNLPEDQQSSTDSSWFSTSFINDNTNFV